MSSTALVIKIISVLLQYGMLLWLLFFLLRVTFYMLRDVRGLKKNLSVGQSRSGAKLTVLQAEDRSMVGREFPLTRELTFGRADDNDILLHDNFVSHHHAIIVAKRNLYLIEDLGSVNGTYVNDHLLHGRAYLKDKDIIRIGYLTMKFER